MDEGLYVAVPPDSSAWSWIIVITTFFCNFFIEGVMFTFGMFIKPFMEYFQASLTQVCVIPALNFLLYFISGKTHNIFSFLKRWRLWMKNMFRSKQFRNI